MKPLVRIIGLTFALWFIVAARIAFGQTPTALEVQPTSFHFYSYSPVSQPIPPSGYIQALTFPDQTSGSQDTLAACRTYNDLTYNHYTWNGPGQTLADWSGPVTGPLIRTQPTMFDSTTGGPTLGSWAGLAIDAAFVGGLGSSDGAQYNAFIQATFMHTNPCFEYGPEFGFYRLLQHPGNATEESTIYLYYTLNGNCYVVGALSSCRSRTNNSSLIPDSTSIPITMPSGTNSQGGYNWRYEAYLTTPTNFHVRIRDPYTLTDAITPVDSTVDSYFVSTASEMYNFGLTGWISTTQQRNSAPGGLTDNPMNPLKILTRSVSRLLPLAVIAVPVFGMSRDSGFCENGGRTVTISGVTATQRVQGSYPSCQVTVYQTGTANLATIYSDNSGTPKSNPFSASTSGFWSYYAQNGTYDVQLSGGSPSFPTAVALGARTLFDVTNSTTIGPYTLPSSVATGCWYDNGLGVLSTIGCGVGGGANAVQFNNSGAFGGASTFTWNNSTNVLSVDGSPGTAAISVIDGNITAAEGFVSSYDSYNGFRSTLGGADVRGVRLSQRSGGSTGGYTQLVPLSGLNFPTALSGASFGSNDGLLWVSGTNATVTPNTSYGLNTNLFINAAGGVVTNNTPFNSIQAPSGGMYAHSFTALNYVQTGNSAGSPSVSVNDNFHAGAMYYDTNDSCEKVHNGTSFACLGGGGGGSGTPGGATTNVQYNSSGSFAGSANFIWSNAGQLLTVTAINSSSPGIVVGTGFMQADKGFLATGGSATDYNSIQAPGGGMYAKSFTALKYIQAGNNNGVPSLTGTDSFNPGALYWDLGSHGLQVRDEMGGWQAVAIGGATSPGGATTNVQYNNAGVFGGSANFTFNSATQLLTVTALNSTSAGIVVGTGFIQSAKGFLATGATATNYDSVQAPAGGMEALSFTAVNYVQVGNAAADITVPTSSDMFHPGTLFYNTTDDCLKVYTNAMSFSCVTGGGGGTPGGATTNVQYNNAGAFGGSANFTWNNAGRVLTVSAASSATAGIAVGTGFIQSDAGFYATVGTATSYQAIQAPGGGLYGRSMRATTYLNMGSSSGTPTATSGDTITTTGTMYMDTSLSPVRPRFWEGSNWRTVAATADVVLGINGSTGGQFTLQGTTNQINVGTVGAVVTFSTPQSIATTSNVTFGTATTNGVMQAVVSGTNIAFQTGNFNFQVNGNGVVSGQQINVAGSTSINSSNQFVGAGVAVGPSGGVGALSYNPWNTGTSSYATGYSPGTPTTLPVGARPIVLGGVIVGYI